MKAQRSRGRTERKDDVLMYRLVGLKKRRKPQKEINFGLLDMQYRFGEKGHC